MFIKSSAPENTLQLTNIYLAAPSSPAFNHHIQFISHDQL